MECVREDDLGEERRRRGPGVLLAEFHSMERNEKFCGVREKFD